MLGNKMLSEYYQFVSAHFRVMNTPLESALHVAIGVAGEWLELCSARTKDHRIEESGDCEFYITAGFTLFGEPERKTPGIIINPYENWAEQAGLPLDIVKKAWVYDQPFDPVIFIRALTRVEDNLRDYYKVFLEVSREEVLSANLAKLRKRFPSGKFTPADAAERKDKK